MIPRSRRAFLASTLAIPLLGTARAPRRLRVAALATSFFPRSHAHVILENFLEPYIFNGEVIRPEFEVASLYIDQPHPSKMGPKVADDYRIPLTKTIAEALTIGGTGLNVDAVLMIAELGDYPLNAKGQKEYPRKRFHDEIMKVFRASGRVAPVFVDKHFSYRWDWARAMVEECRELKVPLMAGSSVPLAERRPPLELPTDAPIAEAVAIHGGPLESYDFHALEVLQSVVEGRRGGETGVESVRMLEGDALWKAAEAGDWSPELARAAMATELGPDIPPIRELVANRGWAPPRGILIRYKDGLKGTTLAVGTLSDRWTFAYRLEGEIAPRATRFYGGPWANRNLFRALSHAIQTFFREGVSPYPLERTILTTGVLAAAIESNVGQGRSIADPDLAKVTYAPRDFRRFREMGASWRVLTEGTPEPMAIDTRFRER